MAQSIGQVINYDRGLARVELTLDEFKIMLEGLVCVGRYNHAASILEAHGFTRDSARKTIRNIKREIDNDSPLHAMCTDFGSNDWILS